MLQKLKWDEDETDLDEMDEDDRQAFETLRKVSLKISYPLSTSYDAPKGDLRVQLDSILTIDQDLVISSVQRLVLDTLTAYQRGTQIKWTDAELAIYLIYIFGEINKCMSRDLAYFLTLTERPNQREGKGEPLSVRHQLWQKSKEKRQTTPISP